MDYLAPLPERMEGYKLEDMRIAWYKTVILPANWKTSLDAFIESWHVPGTHPQLLRPDKQDSPPTIAESENYGATFNELFRYHSRHADIFRYGPDGDADKVRAAYGVDSASHLPQRRVHPARAARALPHDRPGGRRRAAARPRERTGRRATPSTSSCARSMPGRSASTTPTSPATS